MKKLLIGVTLFILLSACSAQTATPTIAIRTPTVTPEPTIAPLPADLPSQCGLEPFVVPTMPAKIPGYLEVDPATGLHMTGTPTEVDFAAYRFTITGKVDHPLSFTYDQLRCLPKVTASPTLICERIFTDHASWSGVSLKYLLDLAGMHKDATVIKLFAADGYVLNIKLADALKDESFLAYELNGQTLPVLHGFPLRAVFPNLTGFNWVKWLTGIEVQ